MAVIDFTLDLLDVSFSIRVDEDIAYLEDIREKYRLALDNTRKIFNLKDPLVTAILTGFMLSDELHKERTQTAALPPDADNEAREAEELARNIIARIDRVLEDKIPGEA